MSNLKDQFLQPPFIRKLGEALESNVPGVHSAAFAKSVTESPWSELELMDRMRKVTDCLRDFLPEDYPEAVKILRMIGPGFSGFDALVFADFVGRYGVDHLNESIPALQEFTELCSSEFAVRPFIERYPDAMFRQLESWARSENKHHRRLASEGCRPRLPWSSSLRGLKRDPAPIIPILEILKSDPEDYVRRSVANNLNDISKDHPNMVIALVKRWQGGPKETDWIVKHACRTLLKQGRADVLELFGFTSPSAVASSPLIISPKVVSIGESISMSCRLMTQQASLGKLRVEYLVHFIKSNGAASPKVFQVFEKVLTASEQVIEKRHSFKDLSTRKHYAGSHWIEIRVNGVVMAQAELELSD
jgi:3-methyladenine DNA glycosylase AlkC